MSTETKPSVGRIKSNNQDSSSKGKVDSSAVNKRKIDSSKKQQSAQPKSGSTVIKTEVKSKAASSSSKTTSTRVREKKVFTLPGQKFDRPEEREPLRMFYESLSKQIPTSEMAEFWMMEHGLLPPDKAKKVYEKKQRKQKQLWMGTPTKSSKPLINKPESSQKPQQASKNGNVKAKNRVTNDSDDDDFILSPKKRKG